MKFQDLIQKIDEPRVVESIARAESVCSAEIRVHIEPALHGHEARTFAERTFERLGMTKTVLRNGVLVFVSAEEQQVVVLGDDGINQKVPPGFWDEVLETLKAHFREQRFTDGIVEAVHMIGPLLAEHFPRRENDVDELPNALSLGEDPDRR